MPQHGHQPESFHRPSEAERMRSEAIAEFFSDFKRRVKALFSHDSDEHAAEREGQERKAHH